MKRRPGLAARLSVLIFAATMVTTAATAVLGALVGSSSLARGVQDNVSQLVRAYSDSINLYFDDSESLLVATAPRVRAPEEGGAGVDLRTAVLLAKRLRSASGSFEYVMLVDAEGQVLLTEPAGAAQQLSRGDVAFADWFRQVKKNRRTEVSDLVVSIVTQRPSVAIAVPLVDPGGEFRGAWVGGLELGSLSRFAPAANASSSAYGYVTDSRGLIVAHQARPDFVLAQTDYSSVPTVSGALQGRQGTAEYISTADGRPKIGAFLPLRAGRRPDERPWAVAYVISSEVAFRPVRVVTFALAGLAALFGGVLALLAALTIRRTLRPMDLLAAAARQMEAGNLAARAPHGMRDELAEMARAFNGMAASVEASQQRLAARALELERSAAQLQAANKELEAFSYSVSHDLRAPLRSIDGFSKAILEDYEEVLDDEGKEYLGLLRGAAQQMGVLIDDMLTLSRATRGELVLTDVDLTAAAREIVSDLAGQDPSRRVRLEVDEGLRVSGDARLLRSVLQNLLENAWKFTRGRDPSLIEFGSDELPDGSRHFYVRDNGVGFDMKYVDKLFQPFQRLHRTEDFEGTGIGLVSVKRILARHGGTVWAASEPGKGTTIHFTVKDGRHHEEQVHPAG